MAAGRSSARRVIGSPFRGVVTMIPGVSMSLGHTRLYQVARDAGFDHHDLVPGQYIMLLNSAGTACKLIVPGGWIAHFKSEDGKFQILVEEGLEDLPSLTSKGYLAIAPKVVQYAMSEYKKKLKDEG